MNKRVAVWEPNFIFTFKMKFTRTYALILATCVALSVLSGTIKNFPYLAVIFSLPMFLLPEKFEGSRGTIGFYGDPGIGGPTGPLGYTGDNGYVGYKGPDGAQGPIGPSAPWPKYRGPPGITHSNAIHIGPVTRVSIPGDFIGVFIGLGAQYLFVLKSSLVAGEPIRFRQIGLSPGDTDLNLLDISYTLTFKDGTENSSSILAFTKFRTYKVPFGKFDTRPIKWDNLKAYLDIYWHPSPIPINFVKVIHRDPLK